MKQTNSPKAWTLALASLLVCGTLTQAADWPQYRGPNADGTSPEKLIGKAWPAAGPKVLWRRPMTDGFSSFAVSGGKAYTIVGQNVGGVVQEVVAALNADNSQALWATPIGIAKYGHDGGNAGTADNKGGDGPRTTPTVEGGNVYAISADLVLVCLDAAKGTKKWSRDIMKEHGGANITWKNAASPVIDGNLIFMAGGGPGQALLALDKTTGKTVWKTQDDKMTHSTPVVRDIHGVRQVIFFTQRGLVSCDVKNGAVLWRWDYKFNVSTAISPVVSGDIVYVSAGYGVGAGACKVAKSDAGFTATELWRKNNELPNHWSTPVVKDGYLYGMFQFKEYGTGPLKCVELATGKEMWSKSGFGPGNVLLVDNHIIVLGDAGQLVLVEATTKGYTEIANAKVITGKCWSTPALADGKLYLRSTKEGVCLDLGSKVASAK
ncbi:MAG: outer rane biosis protein [Verrucomicrobia bacterium]|jgi:outer membrane protein assembly factor BamB|nr:outer rane biosis protein [Verrucomicrobiota bacterium]